MICVYGTDTADLVEEVLVDGEPAIVVLADEEAGLVYEAVTGPDGRSVLDPWGSPVIARRSGRVKIIFQEEPL